MIVPCGHPFGTEAPVDHLGRGFFYLVSGRPHGDAHAVRAGLAELDDILDEAIGLGLRRLDDRRIRLPMQRRILLGSLARERMIFRAKSRSVASSIW